MVLIMLQEKERKTFAIVETNIFSQSPLHKGKMILFHTWISFNSMTQVVWGSCVSPLMHCKALFIFLNIIFLIHLFRAIFYPHRKHFMDSRLSLDEQQFSRASFQLVMGLKNLIGGWESSTKTRSTRNFAFGSWFVQDPKQPLNTIFLWLKLSLNTLQ